jgi:hypothetical protein
LPYGGKALARTKWLEKNKNSAGQIGAEKKQMDIEWLAAAMREANAFIREPRFVTKSIVVSEPALVRRHQGVSGLDGDLD